MHDVSHSLNSNCPFPQPLVLPQGAQSIGREASFPSGVMLGAPQAKAKALSGTPPVVEGVGGNPPAAPKTAPKAKAKSEAFKKTAKFLAPKRRLFGSPGGLYKKFGGLMTHIFKIE